MTGKRDQKRRPPNLLASLPEERPAPGPDPAVNEEILAGQRELREVCAALQQAQSADRSARAESDEALKEWFESLVARYAETARVAAPDADAMADRIEAVQAHLSERIDALAGNLAADRTETVKAIGAGIGGTVRGVINAEVEGAVSRAVDPALQHAMTLQDNGIQGVSREIAGARHDVLEAVRERQPDPNPRFGRWARFAPLIAFALGMLFESKALLFYRWLWAA